MGKRILKNSRLAAYRALGLVLAIILVLIGGAIIFTKNKENRSFDIAAPCAQWGLGHGDPRARPADISPQNHPIIAAHEDSIQLNQPFEFEGIRGRYHFFTRGIDYSKPVGLLVRLHGDGGYEFSYPNNLPNCLASVAASYNMIMLAPESPVTDPDDTELTWWKDLPTKRKWVSALVKEKLSRIENVDRTNIWWMGYSGGAEFLSYGLLNHRTNLITGGTIMVGGGGAPTEAQLRDLDDLERMHIPHHWVVGINDDGSDPKTPFNARRAAIKGEDFYRTHGFTETTRTELEGIDHLNLPQALILDQALEGVLTQRQFPELPGIDSQPVRPAPNIDDLPEFKQEDDPELSIRDGSERRRRHPAHINEHE